jgi:uncharacterized protein (TIGR00251 family)
LAAQKRTNEVLVAALLRAFDGDRVAVRVTPRAGSERIDVTEGDLVKVYVSVPPESGKANARVIEIIAETLGLPKTSLSLLRGERSRNKVLKVQGLKDITDK